MTTTVVIMIIVGLILIMVSFFVTEKLTKKEESAKLDLMTVDENYEFSEREQQIIKRKIEDAIASHAKDILYETNESLSSMANEKTMALGDYAVAVCDEIERNHKEVMFLYSMLEDKQKEIMKTVQDVDKANSDVKKVLSQAEERMLNVMVSEQKVETAPQEQLEENKHQSALDQLAALKQKKDMENLDAEAFENSDMEHFDENEIAEDFDNIFDEVGPIEQDLDSEFEQEFSDSKNSNDLILSLYQKGENIIDIAKQLGLGVGEVKLVIDLYQGD